MGIQIKDIIEALSKDVNSAYKLLKEEKIAVSIPEVEITLNLEVELEGEAEKTPTMKKQVV